MTIRVEHGDCLEVIPQLVGEGVLVDAIVTDPPYGLEFMGKDWDKLDSGLPQESVWKGRRGKGGSNIGNDDATAGGRHHVAFGIKRAGFKRCATCGKRAFSGSPCRCDAPAWIVEYPVGPPSSAVRAQRWHDQWAREAYTVLKPGGYLLAFGGTRTHHRIWCAIEDAGFVIQDTIMWLYGSGFPKGRTQLKPAFEPICVAYKPGGKRVLQIDECRVAAGKMAGGRLPTYSAGYGLHQRTEPWQPNRLGRWPANVCHDGSDEVMEALAAFGESKSSRALISKPMKRQDNQVYGEGLGSIGPENTFSDAGTAARFFYGAKADVEDRWGSKHPTVKPVELIRWLVRLVTPPQGTVLDCFAGSGTTAVAAMAEGRNAILIEREAEYIADIRVRVAHYEGSGRHSLAAKHRSRSNSRKPLPLLDEPGESDRKMRGGVRA